MDSGAVLKELEYTDLEEANPVLRGGFSYSAFPNSLKAF